MKYNFMPRININPQLTLSSSYNWQNQCLLLNFYWNDLDHIK